MTDDELKAKTKMAILEYLKNQGWSNNLSIEQVIREHLPSMWRHLDSVGLVGPLKERGHIYQVFINMAVKKAQEQELYNTFGFKFR